MIREIELMRLRDIAFEYLPAARNQMLAAAKFIRYRGDDYWLRLYGVATLQVTSIDMSAIEYASVKLLQAVANYALPMPDDSGLDEADKAEYNAITPEEWRASKADDIERAVKTLSHAAGRAIMIDAGAGSQEVTEPTSTKSIQPSHNDFKWSGLLIIPKNAGNWGFAIDDMARNFYQKNGRLPNKAEAWAQLCKNPPDGYLITQGKA
jgi:nitrogen regulatory protein PII-like uncharacterized protein